MIYKEYQVLCVQAYEYASPDYYKELVNHLQQGWEVVTNFSHTHMECKGRYEYNRQTGSREEIYEQGNPRITFILGRNEAPKALYGKE